MTDVPDLAQIAVVAQTGTQITPLSRQSFRWLSWFQTCVSRKVFLKHQVNSNTVCGAIQDLPWYNIWLADNPVEVLNEHLSLLVGRYVPTKVIRVQLSLGLMVNAGMLLT